MKMCQATNIADGKSPDVCGAEIRTGFIFYIKGRFVSRGNVLSGATVSELTHFCGTKTIH